jgi:hypothetical protein
VLTRLSLKWKPAGGESYQSNKKVLSATFGLMGNCLAKVIIIPTDLGTLLPDCNMCFAGLAQITEVSTPD